MLKYFLLAVVIGVSCTYLVRAAATHLRVLDAPDGDRKRHGRLVPLWGGLALFVSFWGLMVALIFFHPMVGIDRIANSLGALFFGSLLLLLIGLSDDLRPFSSKVRMIFLLTTAGIVAYWLPLERITNPLGGHFLLPQLAGWMFVFGWLVVTTISVKVWDAIDGLAVSTALVAALMIVGITLSRTFYQPNVALVALIFAGALIGFLIFNRPPATIFLGESGSLFVGFMLGALSILSGSKIATALLVMAVPVLDVLRVVVIRLKKKQPLFQGDRSHLPLALLDRGWSEWQVLVFLVGIALAAGLVGLFLQSAAKLIALALVAIGFFLLVVRFGLMKNS